ncbi:MAG TPA: serine/threonine-protein kinase, partial [Polyangiaceae bacterium]|nr:serine/threonine-protein kinase [Polyangiaceae bacterium]
MARVRTSGKVGALGNDMPRNSGPLSQLPAQLIPSNLLPSQLVAKWLPALAHGFEPAAGALVTPRLRLIRHIGDERPGSLWVADHLALATPVEVAFAEVEPGASPESQAGALALCAQSFQAQTEMTAVVNEPHLVSIIEHGDVRGLPFIVTELLEGKGMRQRLLHGPAKLAEVHTIVLQASGALSKAHSLGVSHGRLRPDYLYLTELAQKPFLKIAGFGEPIADFQVSGQLAYASPEQLLHGAGNDARSDLWSFAVALYELLTTTLPFEAPTPAGVSVAICNSGFARPSHYRADLPPAVDAWFARALAKDPGQRFSDAAELSRAFIAALANEAPVSAGPTSSGPAPLLASASIAHSAGLPLPSFPPPSSPPISSAPLSAGELLAGDGEDRLPLALADGDDDERTVQWEVPEAPPAAGAGASHINLAPVALPSLASRLPILPLPAPLSAAALSSVALPSTSSQRASAGPLGAPPSLEPSVYLDSPYVASVASALAVPVSSMGAPESQRPISLRRALFSPDKTWLAALAFAAGVAVTWFAYDPASDDDAGADVASREGEPSVIRTLSVDDLPRAPGEEAALPKIVRTSQLPSVSEDELAAANAAPNPPPPVERRAAPVQRVHALVPAPAPPRGSVPSRSSVPRSPVPPRSPAPAKSQPAPRNQPVAEARTSCSPPYYFDDKGIQ